jgi:hypothetical protein
LSNILKNTNCCNLDRNNNDFEPDLIFDKKVDDDETIRFANNGFDEVNILNPNANK